MDERAEFLNTLHDLPTFTGVPGLLKELPDSPTPLDYFYLFFTEQIIEIMVRETNRYAEQVIAASKNVG